jgi:acyl-CoA thioesterase FadM
MHIHYLQEVKQTDTAIVTVRIAGADHKRIHAAFEVLRAGQTPVAAAAEVMLLHVCQGGDAVRTVPFPAEVSAAIAQLQAACAGLAAAGPGSRRMELRPATRTP